MDDHDEFQAILQASDLEPIISDNPSAHTLELWYETLVRKVLDVTDILNYTHEQLERYLQEVGEVPERVQYALAVCLAAGAKFAGVVLPIDASPGIRMAYDLLPKDVGLGFLNRSMIVLSDAWRKVGR